MTFRKVRVIGKGICPRIDLRSRGKPGPRNGLEQTVEGNNTVDS